MNCTTLVILFFLFATCPFTEHLSGPSGAPLIRVAVPGFAQLKTTHASRALDAALADSISNDHRVTLVDQSIVRSALAGFGYDGSINMTKDEARKLASAIGCDFFIIGKAEAFTRSERSNESHEQAYAGVMIVEGRTGALTLFDFISGKAPTREEAAQSLVKSLGVRMNGYLDRMIKVREQMATQTGATETAEAGPVDIIEDIPSEDSPRSLGFKPPEFLNRVKPDYTAEAELADITATVEAMVVFGSNGELERIEITRWAGFGLDESSERAIRQLRFKPATRDGRPISVRAMIRYNFRRAPESPDKPASKAPAKPERDLREIFKPTFRRPLH
jgi:TonB family protein